MKARYDIRPDQDGWTVYYTRTDFPAPVNNVPQIGLSLEHADNLTDLLNRLHTKQSATLAH